jgi:hypothetical protein
MPEFAANRTAAAGAPRQRLDSAIAAGRRPFIPIAERGAFCTLSVMRRISHLMHRTSRSMSAVQISGGVS